MKVTYITTVGHNPGDEFIRDGIVRIVESVVGPHEIALVHKHDPRSLYRSFSRRENGGSPHRLIAPLKLWLYEALHGRSLSEDKILNADVIVFAGTPYIWRHNTALLPSTCANAEWIRPVWSRLESIHNKVPILNLAAGSSLPQGYGSEWITRNEECVKFLKRAGALTRLTTVRDRLAHDILDSLGVHNSLIPCASILSVRESRPESKEPTRVCVNYMRRGGHGWRGNKGADGRWKTILREVLAELRARYEVLFVCHSEKEQRHAREDFPTFPSVFTSNYRELLESYSQPGIGLCNRVHSAAGLVANGLPALVVGLDSRVQLVQEFGLPIFSVYNVSSSEIIGAINAMAGEFVEWQDRIRELKERVLAEYCQTVKRALG